MAYRQPPYRPATRAADAPTDLLKLGKWSAALALLLALLALLTSFQLFQATAEGTSKRTLRRSVAVLTEIDPLLDRNYDQLQRDAQNAAAGDTVKLAGFPIDVPLEPAEVAGLSKDDLRSRLLDRAADQLYGRGAGALRDPAGRSGSAGRFTIAGSMERGLGFLRSRNHNILAVTTLLLAVVCAALALALASACRGFGRVTAIGAVVLAASLPVLAAGLIVRLYVQVSGSGEYTRREFLDVWRGLAWIPIRDGAAFAAVGLALLVAGYMCAMWSSSNAGSAV